MRIYTRKAEKDAIVALLEDDTYATADSLADAILKTAYGLLLERDFFLTVVRVDELNLVYGLTASPAEANKWELTAGFPRMVLPVISAEGKIRQVKELGI